MVTVIFILGQFSSGVLHQLYPGGDNGNLGYRSGSDRGVDQQTLCKHSINNTHE